MLNRDYTGKTSKHIVYVCLKSLIPQPKNCSRSRTPAPNEAAQYLYKSIFIWPTQCHNIGTDGDTAARLPQSRPPDSIHRLNFTYRSQDCSVTETKTIAL